MGKLWQKDYDLDALIEQFTVGIDYQLDLKLVPSDCIASIAHAVMLHSIGLLTDEELTSLKKGLKEIIEESINKRFTILLSEEDCHTAIENRLTVKYGEAGQKIHTGRSRNDQVVTALRLYTKELLLKIIDTLLSLVSNAAAFAERHKAVPMPGRTHLQTAMPSSVGLWATSFAEELLDDGRLLFSVYRLINQCPLGSAAGYGVPLPIDREMTSDLLGFEKVQNNVLYANNSRGKFESIVLDALDQAVLTLSKLSQDLILFSLPEFGYFRLPARLCSGSSIMPQKKNPDALELIRAKAASLSACSAQVKGIIRSLPSGYNRDFQETKEPFLRGSEIALLCLKVADLTILNLEVNPENLAKGFPPDIFAADAALELAARGISFRDAYKEVGLNLSTLESRRPADSIASRTSTGTAGNLRLDKVQAEAEEVGKIVSAEDEKFHKAITELLGFNIRLC
ncbi:MAG: argininosuccinate lyase [Spirochaetota bacterium]